MSQTAPPLRFFRMPLQKEPDVVLCRNRARLLAEKCGYQRQDQIRIATAVSEIARNAFRYAVEPVAEFCLEAPPRDGSRKFKNLQMLVCRIQDKGPGIPNLEEVLGGQYRSKTGMGTGLIGAHRLMDKVEVDTSPAGTTVLLARELPRGVVIRGEDVGKITGEVMGPARPDVLEQLAEQDKEVLVMFREVREKTMELSKVNEELSETNRGVVALYDELDTVYRVGHVLASKLELDNLLQAIIDATTEISGADIGIFVYCEPEEENETHQHTAGPLASHMEGQPALRLETLFGSATGNQDATRFVDLRDEPEFSFSLHPDIELRSFLAVPVFSGLQVLVGAMVFSHQSPAFFSDRSERILASVALQASIGIDNAKLYKNVQSANAAKDEFLAILSHELRNPLNPIFARLSLLEEDVRMPEDARDHLRMIRSNLELETRLIDDLLDMTRIARGKVVLTKSPCDLNVIVESARHACSSFAGQQSVKVVLLLEADRPVVNGDAVRLQQVFWNLINNAIKFSQPGSEVQVRIVRVDKDILITVRDSGRGIATTMLEKIFQPFEQVEANTANASGLGLGLAICRSIIQAHDGTILAGSQGADQGAVFTVILEASSVALAEPVQAPSGPAGEAKGHTFDILLVDDHEDTRRSFKVLLERRGHRVTIAGSVAEACAAAGQQRFQLLISDIGLPDATGHDLMRILATDPNLKAIAVSGYGMKEDIQRSQQAGFSVHLTKPLKIAELHETIAALMA